MFHETCRLHRRSWRKRLNLHDLYATAINEVSQLLSLSYFRNIDRKSSHRPIHHRQPESADMVGREHFGNALL